MLHISRGSVTLLGLVGLFIGVAGQSDCGYNWYTGLPAIYVMGWSFYYGSMGGGELKE